MKFFGVMISAVLSLLSLIHIADAHCFSCRKVVYPPKVKVIVKRKKVLVPNYSVTYAPSIQPPAIIVPPPIIKVAGPTIIQPPSVAIAGASVTAATRAAVVGVAKVTGAVVERPPLRAPAPTCEELLVQFKAALDACEAREQRLGAQLLQIQKKFGIVPKKEEPRKGVRPEEKEVDPAQAKAAAVKFLKASCLACHSKENAGSRGGDNKYVIDPERMTRNQGLYMLAKVQSGDMPKMPNKHGIKEATEQDLNALEDYVNTLR